IAVLSSAALQAQYEELAAGGAKYGAARALPNPEVQLQLLFPTHAAHSTEIELLAVESITGLLAMVPRAHATDAELRAARRRATALTVELWAEARLAFYRAVAADQALALRRTVAESGAAAAELARALYKSGGIAELDLTRELLFEESAALAVTTAEAD